MKDIWNDSGGLPSLSAPVASITITVTGSNPTFFATPTSGAAPLTVVFSNMPTSAAEEEFNYGDGESTSDGFNGSWPKGSLTHTYTTPGTYTATVVGQMSNGPLGTATITVTGSNSTVETASLDVSQMLYKTSSFSITGPSSNAHSIVIYLIDSKYNGSTNSNDVAKYLTNGSGYLAFQGVAGAGQRFYDVASNGGRWSVDFSGIPTGSYRVYVYSGDAYSPYPLANGTLSVQ